MAPKKLAVTSKALQALLTRIGSASSGTKPTLLARFQRDVQQPGFFNRRHGCDAPKEGVQSDKLRVVSIDMGIKNLAFCDAEISRASTTNTAQQFDAHMHVLRWKKLDLVGGAESKSTYPAMGDEEGTASALDEEEGDQFSPSVLSKTAHRLIVEEILSARPDIILIEKQRWRSGGGSAVQQWTVRVNTLEAMLWAILETVKQQGGGLGLAPHNDNNNKKNKQRPETSQHGYRVYAVDPKRVGQYWLSQHARALQSRGTASAAVSAAGEDALLPSNYSSSALGPSHPEESQEEGESSKKTKKPHLTRSKAEKSAKIAILRSWLTSPSSSTTTTSFSTAPSTSPGMPKISFTIASEAEATRQALLPKTKSKTKPKIVRRKKAETSSSSSSAIEEVVLGEEIPTTEIKKLDDVADAFLQAAAWVAWEGMRGLLLGVQEEGEMEGKGKEGKGKGDVVDEGRVLRMVERCGEL